MSAAGAEGRVVTSRIVVFGAAGAGTTSTLETIWRRLRADQRGQIVRQAPAGDAAAAYEVLPVDLGDVNGLHRRVQLATVPHGAANVGSRRQLLKGVDGVIFVADSAPEKLKDAMRAIQELSEHLSAYGRALQTVPLVILLNKRDLPNAVPSEQLLKPLLERMGGRRPPVFEGVATDGRGILNALSAVAKLVLARAQGAPAAAAPAPAAAAPAAAAPRPRAAAPAARPREAAGLTVSAALDLDGGVLDGAAPRVAVGTPRATAGAILLPLVLTDARGGEHRLTLSLRIALAPPGAPGRGGSA